MKAKLVYVLIALVMVLSLAAALVPAQVALAATLQVGPGQPYTTIQAAIDAAAPGDTIVVNNGVYHEQVVINKRVTLVSANGSAVTTIDSSGLTDLSWMINVYENCTATFYPAVQIQTSNVVLGTTGKGFTITGADALVWGGDPEEIQPGRLPFESGVGILDLAAGCVIGGNNISTNCWGLLSGYAWGVPSTMVAGNTFYGNVIAMYLVGGWGAGYSSNETVQNNNFINNFAAVEVEGTNGPTSSRIINNILRGNGQGIEIHGGCSNTTISGNNISDTHSIAMDWDGFTLTSGGDAINVDYGSSSNTVFNNTISTITPGLEAAVGIHINRGSNSNTVLSNRISGCDDGMRLDNGSNENTVRSNVINDCFTNGIAVWQSDNNDILQNSVYNCGTGIDVNAPGCQNEIGRSGAGNTVHNCGEGIKVSNSWDEYVVANTVYDCGVAIYLTESNNIWVQKNVTFFRVGAVDVGNLVGIWVENSNSNRLGANNIKNNDIGIQLTGDSGWNEIRANDIRANNLGGGGGIMVCDSVIGTNIHCNNIVGNLDWGLANFGSNGVNARNNWWGAADGPSGCGPGSGDALSGPGIDFSNWATSAYTFPDRTAPVITEAFADTDIVSLLDTDLMGWVMGDVPYSIGPNYTKLIVNTGDDICSTCGVTVDLSGVVMGLLPADIESTVSGWQQDETWKWDQWQNWMSELSNQQMYYMNCNGNGFWAYDLYLNDFMNNLKNYFGDDVLTKMVLEQFRPGQFSIPVAAYDCSGNSDKSSLADIDLAIVDFQLSLEEGWNLRSTPIALSGTWGTWGAVMTLGNGMDRGIVMMKWDAKKAKWAALRSKDKIEPLQAYYIYVDQNDTMGCVIERGVTAAPSIQLSTGWNLIALAPYVRSFGGMSTDTALSTINLGSGSEAGWSAIVSLEQGLGYDQQCHYNGCYMGSYWEWLQQNGWVGVPGGDSWQMQCGGGYWVFMNNPGMLGGYSYTPIPMDSQPPWLQSFEIDPDVIDTTAGELPVTFTLHLGDEASGFRNGYVIVSSPTGNQGRGIGFSNYDLYSGGNKDGVYNCDIYFFQYGEPGTWHVQEVTLWDGAGNMLYMDEAGLNSAGFDTEIYVTCLEDVTDPELVDFTFTPDIIDTAGGPAEVAFTLNMSDGDSGISQAYLNFRSPSSSNWRSAWVNEPDDRTSGSSHDGGYEGVITFPQYSENGTWVVDNVHIRDQAGNWMYCDTYDLDDMGFPTELVVN